MVEIVAFLVFMRTRLNMQPYSPLKPTKVGFIFIGPNSLSRAKDLAAVNHVTQAVVRVGSKIGNLEFSEDCFGCFILNINPISSNLKKN